MPWSQPRWGQFGIIPTSTWWLIILTNFDLHCICYAVCYTNKMSQMTAVLLYKVLWMLQKLDRILGKCSTSPWALIILTPIIFCTEVLTQLRDIKRQKRKVNLLVWQCANAPKIQKVQFQRPFHLSHSIFVMHLFLKLWLARIKNIILTMNMVFGAESATSCFTSISIVTKRKEHLPLVTQQGWWWAYLLILYIKIMWWSVFVIVGDYKISIC